MFFATLGADLERQGPDDPHALEPFLALVEDPLEGADTDVFPVELPDADLLGGVLNAVREEGLDKVVAIGVNAGVDGHADRCD